MPRLTPDARERVRHSQQRAVFELITGSEGAAVDPELRPAHSAADVSMELASWIWRDASFCASRVEALGVRY